MISERFCLVDTMPAVSIFGDRGGAKAFALGFQLDWTRCHYGGLRPWFVCPRCGRRCAKLYPIQDSPDPDEARCRLCLLLGYWSRRIGPMERLAYGAHRIRERLGGAPDLSIPYPPRPAGMHRRTYARLLRRVRELERACYDADLEAWARMARHREAGRSATRYWEARDRFLAAYAPNRQAFLREVQRG